MSFKKEQMRKNLNDSDFRKQFINAHVDEGIAFQIRALRNRQQLKQSELAQLMGVRQPLIASWENPNYGKYTLNTLKDLAKAFDVGLLVRFVPFSTVIDWTVDLTPDAIAPPSFDEEQFHAVAPIPELTKKKEMVQDTTDINIYDLLNPPEPGVHPSTAVKELANVT